MSSKQQQQLQGQFVLQSLDPYGGNPSARLDAIFGCLELVNTELDLCDFNSLITKIESLQHTSLTKWKSAFTTKFLKSLKDASKSPPFPKRLRAELLSMSNFTAFVVFYDAHRADSELESFYAWVSEQKFVLSVEAESVTAELEKVIQEKYWASKLEFTQGALKLIAQGVQLAHMFKFLKDAFRIDPNPSIRLIANQINVEDEEDAAPSAPPRSTGGHQNTK
ncbi:MAG: hypothetical protein WC763_05945 [Candidatus Paceibacterota bacterium]|jgi:hypothetical protein